MISLNSTELSLITKLERKKEHLFTIIKEYKFNCANCNQGWSVERSRKLKYMACPFCGTVAKTKKVVS